MLEGIEILSQSEVGINYEPMWGLSGIIGGISLLIFLVLGIIYWIRDSVFGDFIAFAVIGLMSGAVVFGIFCTITDYLNYTDTQTQYKVTISNEVSLNEFNEHYEIIKQEGKIYTIVEKE